MNRHHIFKLSFSLLLVLTAGAPAFSRNACRDAATTRSADQRRATYERMQEPDPTDGPIQRRIKILTTGAREDAVPTMDKADVRIDTADPSLVMPVTYPNGKKTYRINFSGMRYIEADRIADFFRGGIRKVKHSRGFYPDGTEMRGAYHLASWPWDVVIYRNERGENIALGGVMEQPAPGELPNVAQHNRTRSRWWGKVEYIELPNGEFEEHIIWQAPVHDFNTTAGEGWVRHGYGGTLLTKFNPKTGEHELVKNAKGNYLLFYERVTEERNGRPWVTTQFVREMDPSMTHTVGPETMVTDIISPVTGKPFEATRRGTAESIDGYLAEGGNVLLLREGGAVEALSGNDYVRQYGIYLTYLPPDAHLQQAFKPVVDDKGELIDFASRMNLRQIMNATWVGRPQLEYAPDGKLWMKFHFQPIHAIPRGGPVEGWPSKSQFKKYARITAEAPVKITYDHKGQPNLELDLDPIVH